MQSLNRMNTRGLSFLSMNHCKRMALFKISGSYRMCLNRFGMYVMFSELKLVFEKTMPLSLPLLNFFR